MCFNVFTVFLCIGFHCFQLCFLASLCSARACAGEAAPAGNGADPEGKPSSGSSSSSASSPSNHSGGRQLSLGPFALHHDANPLCIFGKVYCLLYMGSQAYTQRLASETLVVTITSVHLVVPSIYLLNRHTPFIEPLSQSNDDKRQKDLGAMLHGIHHNLNDPLDGISGQGNGEHQMRLDGWIHVFPGPQH